MNATKAQKKIYCFDTSALLALSRTNETIIKIDTVWDHLSKMMKGGSLISHQIVFDEIMSGVKNPPQIIQWVSKEKKYFLSKSVSQVSQVPSIVRAFPDLIDPGYEKEQADPWLIALAIEKSNVETLFEVRVSVVVSQEKLSSHTKIPAACKHFKINHNSLREFFDTNGLSINLHKK